MPEQKVQEDKENNKPFWTDWKAAAVLISLPVLGFMLSTIWHLVMGYGAEIASLKAEVKILQDANAQWATLAEVQHRQQEMEVPVGIVMWLLEHGKIKETDKPSDVAIKIPRLESVSVEDFRRIQEERFRTPVSAAQMRR